MNMMLRRTAAIPVHCTKHIAESMMLVCISQRFLSLISSLSDLVCNESSLEKHLLKLQCWGKKKVVLFSDGQFLLCKCSGLITEDVEVIVFCRTAADVFTWTTQTVAMGVASQLLSVCNTWCWQILRRSTSRAQTDEVAPPVGKGRVCLFALSCIVGLNAMRFPCSSRVCLGFLQISLCP